MKIQIASDLHLEGLQESLREKCPTLIAPAPDADLLVLAGDIHEDCTGIELFKDWPVPVLYVPGNHEFYGVGWRGALEHMRRACDGTGITLLDKDEVVIDGVRFLGATLWTDFKINVPTEVAMSAAQTQLLDYFRIKTQMGLLKARNTLDEHYNARSWLKRELEKPFDGTTVVITHHAPHPKSVAARYESDVLTGAFVSDLSEILESPHAPALWIHGHCHDGFDYQVGRCRVVSNPAGYVLNRARVAAGDTPVWENPSWRNQFVVEVV
jgi:Icc-related predicted phosphoesterase